MQSFSEQERLKKPKIHHLENKLRSLKAHVAVRHCQWLLTALLFQVIIINILVFFFTHAELPLQPAAELQLHSLPPDTGKCESGRVYAYNIPEMFNKDFLVNCHNIDPWSSRCDAVSNGGFGPRAAGLDDVVPENLREAWYWTDMYAAEVVYHTRILDHDCRAADPKLATAFYIPFYAGLAVGKYLWFNYTAKDRDYHATKLMNWVQRQESWRRLNGSDHFIMLGRLTWDFRRLNNNDSEWGSSFLTMPEMKNVLRLSVEKSQWDDMEISVPYPTGFHPRSDSDLIQWQRFIRSRNRSSLFTFVGATRKKIKNDFRGLLMTHCKTESDVCRVVDCETTRCYDGAPAILQAFLDSDFCLQPKGDGFTRRSFFDCMLAGSIPVFFWKGSFTGQYQWHLPPESSSFSVFIDHNDVRNGTSIVRKVLETYSIEEVKRRREKIIAEILPRFVYARSGKALENTRDAFDVAIDRVLTLFKNHKDQIFS